jgi:hypothetical protein
MVMASFTTVSIPSQTTSLVSRKRREIVKKFIDDEAVEGNNDGDTI